MVESLMSIQYPKIVTNTFHAFPATHGICPITKNPIVYVMSLLVATKLNTVVNMSSSRASASSKEGPFYSKQVDHPSWLRHRYMAIYPKARATAVCINAVFARHILSLHLCLSFLPKYQKTRCADIMFPGFPSPNENSLRLQAMAFVFPLTIISAQRIALSKKITLKI